MSIGDGQESYGATQVLMQKKAKIRPTVRASRVRGVPLEP